MMGDLHEVARIVEAQNGRRLLTAVRVIQPWKGASSLIIKFKDGAIPVPGPVYKGMESL